MPATDFQDARAFLTGGGEKGRQLATLKAGAYRINPALFTVITPANAAQHGLAPEKLKVFQLPSDRIGIVTVLDGRPIPAGDLAGPVVAGHDSFQRGQAFVDAGGCRGLQEDVLLSGSWNLNPWLVQVELVPMTEIPIGYVGVVVSYVGREHLDVSGDDFTHGDLVERGRKGVWNEPLLPGKHPVNPRVMKVELVPTTNIVLNWAQRTEAHHYDERLSPITVRSKDGFSFSLDVSQIIHIGMKAAPRVISRVGSMQNLVDHVLQPTVANYFRNSAQEVTVLEFLSARSQRQKEAYEDIRTAVEAYDVECIDTLIGDIVPPAELMKTQTDRKIADELQRTYDIQRAGAGASARSWSARPRWPTCRARWCGASRWSASPSARPSPPPSRRRVRLRRSASAPRPRPMPSGSGARPRRPRRAPSARARRTPTAWASPQSVRRASPPSRSPECWPSTASGSCRTSR